jgi:hypothetical protein
MAGKWKVNGVVGSARRSISWGELEHFKLTGELPTVGAVSALEGATWPRPLRLAADTDVNKVAAEAIRVDRPPDPYAGLSALARDPALVDIFKEYHDRKVNKPKSLVLDLWLIKALYDAGYALRAEAGISLPLTSGFRRGVWRVFLGVVWAPLLRAADLQTPALFSKTLAGAERLLKHPKIVRGFIKVFKRKYPRVSILTFEAFSHSVEEKIAAAADRYDPTIPKYGNRRAKFTSFLWTALTREFIRFNRRETLGGASINAQIEKNFDDEVKKDIHYDKQQALIDAFEGDRGQTWIDVYADVTGRRPVRASATLAKWPRRSMRTSGLYSRTGLCRARRWPTRSGYRSQGLASCAVKSLRR